jgi:diguanylate cyclase (GGDEF)-like protein
VPYQDIHETASKRRTRSFRIVAPIVLVILCFCAICGYVLVEARSASWKRAAETSASLVAAIESEIVRNIEQLNVSIEGVAKHLSHPDIDRLTPELRQALMFGHSTAARHTSTILVLDRTGHVRFDSRTTKPEPTNYSDRDYFKYHLTKDSQVLYVGQPQSAQKTGAFYIGISRRLTNSSGEFAGVVAGTIHLSHFKQLFKELALGPGGAITLAHTDGTILMRWPFNESLIGRNIKDADIYKMRAKSRSGQVETTDLTDGVRRVVAYSQVRDLPVLVGVGQATRDIFEQWRTYAMTMALLVAALCGLSALLAVHLIRDIRRRDAMERTLVTLATTDGLTGVSNRRHFNEAIGREWRKAQQSSARLALLMIDADQFKLYNDRHGHQAGDRLLTLIGSAIARSIRTGLDVGARFGGDEFAVLLPGATLAEAAEAADRIRERLRVECRVHGVGDDGKVSIGAASLLPGPADSHADLLAAADSALYRAKREGRNRTECAVPEQHDAPAAAPLERAA